MHVITHLHLVSLCKIGIVKVVRPKICYTISLLFKKLRGFLMWSLCFIWFCLVLVLCKCAVVTLNHEAFLSSTSWVNCCLQVGKRSCKSFAFWKRKNGRSVNLITAVIQAMPVSSIIWFANLDSIISIFMKILRCLKANKATVSGEMYLDIGWSVFIQKQTKKKHLELN